MGRRAGSKSGPPTTRRARVRSKGRGLAGALRKLEEALVRDPRELGARAREFGARFHVYSPMNRFLIFLQRPDATFLKGRKQWEQEGRTVRAGARAVQVLAPRLRPGDRALATGFAKVNVYDVSDTDGGPFAPPACSRPRGDRRLVSTRLRELEAWVRGSGLHLRYEAPLVNALVDGATDGLTIWVRPDLGPPERLGVLAHEIAHAKLHFRRKKRGEALIVDAPDGRPPRDVRELEAELTAFLLLELSGVDSARGSAAYLSCWNASATKVRAAAETCFVVACSVLGDCERKRYRSLVQEEVVTALDERRGASGRSDEGSAVTRRAPGARTACTTTPSGAGLAVTSSQPGDEPVREDERVARAHGERAPAHLR